MAPSDKAQSWSRKTIADYVSSGASVCGNFQALVRELLPEGRQSAIDAVQLKNADVYRVPRAVVIGGESVGKSTLGERMTGFPIFPRAARVCTRCPVIVHMRTDPSVDGHSIDVAAPSNQLTNCTDPVKV